MRLSTVFMSALLAASCGESNSATQPTQSARTTGIVMTMPPLLKVGDTAQALAIAILGNGETRALSRGWRSDAPAVATVTTTGLVTAIANGVANISVASDDVQSGQSVRVVPNYHGRWTGTYLIDLCTSWPPGPSYIRFCNDYLPGTTFPLSMTFSQHGSLVSGQIVAGDLVSASFASALNADGSVEAQASTITPGFKYNFTWRLTVTRPGRIVGSVQLARDGNAGAVGGANIQGTILSLEQ